MALSNPNVFQWKKPTKEQLTPKYFEMSFTVLQYPRGNKERVFVRPCYEVLFDLILQDILSDSPSISIAVLGTSGVGTSRFYAYCIMRLSQGGLLQGKKTLIINTHHRYYFYDNGYFSPISEEEVTFYYQGNVDVVRLIDGKSAHLLGWSGVSILFTSESGTFDYDKFCRPKGTEYIMPPWTYLELSLAAKMLHLDEAVVKKRFLEFGGIARYVFSNSHWQWREDVPRHVSSVNLPKLLRDVKVKNGRNYNEVLLHLYPAHANGSPFREFFLNYASNDIADKICARVDEHIKYYMTRNDGTTNPHSREFQESQFELHCHGMWSPCPGTSTVWKGQYLTPDLQPFSISIPNKVETCFFSTLDDIPIALWDNPLYGRLTRDSYPGMDAFYWDKTTCYLLQMTIADRRSVSYAHLVEIVEWWATHPKFSRRIQTLPHVVLVLVVPEEQGQQAYTREKLWNIQTTFHQVPNTKVDTLSQCIVGVKVGRLLAAVTKKAVELNGNEFGAAF